jgi:tetratricopeptide (TPR) repeat protein
MRIFSLAIFLLISSVNYGQNDFLLAEKYYRDGEFKKATQLYQNLHSKNPFNTTYLKRLVNCYQETTQFKVAENLLVTSLIKNPNLVYLNVELGTNFEKQKLSEQAKIYYDKAIKSIDKNVGMGGYIGRLFKDNSLLDYAIAAYKKTMLLNPNTNYEFQIAQIYGEKGNFEKMFSAYVDLIDKKEQYLNTVQHYTSRYITDDKLNSNNLFFKKALIRKSVSKPKDVWNQLLSWLFVQQKEYNKALIQEKALFKRNPKYIQNILSLGYNSFNSNAFETSKDCFEFIIQNSPFIDQKITANLYIVKIAIETNQPNVHQLFENIFNVYGKKPNTIEIQIAYADYLTFKKNLPEKSITVLSEAMKISISKFQKAGIKLKLGDVHVFIGNYNKALIYFSQVQTSIKNHPLAQQARFKVAQTSYFKNDFKWAFAQLKVLKASTTQLIANDALDLFLVISDNQSKDSLDTGLKLYAKADLLAFQNKNEQAIDTLQKIVSTFIGQKIEDEALYKQAHLYRKTNQLDKAINNYQKIIQLDKEGILVDDAIYQLAKLYELKLNNTEKASEYYQKIIFDHPSSIYLVEARKRYRKLRGDTIN